jgi:hypothetical protein
MIWVWRATMEWYWQGKTEELGEKPVPVPLCPPQIPHGLPRARTRASAVRGRRLTTWAITRPRNRIYSSLDLTSTIALRILPQDSIRVRTKLWWCGNWANDSKKAHLLPPQMKQLVIHQPNLTLLPSALYPVITVKGISPILLLGLYKFSVSSLIHVCLPKLFFVSSCAGFLLTAEKVLGNIFSLNFFPMRMFMSS